MNWNLLYQQPFPKGSKKMEERSEEPAKNDMGSSEGLCENENEELYQRRLFENDLYVWSLLLLLPDRKAGLK